MGVEVRVAREMARLVASASAICGREVAWNLGRLWPREVKRFVILTSLVQPETACSEENGSKRHEWSIHSSNASYQILIWEPKRRR